MLLWLSYELFSFFYIFFIPSYNILVLKFILKKHENAMCERFVFSDTCMHKYDDSRTIQKTLWLINSKHDLKI